VIPFVIASPNVLRNNNNNKNNTTIYMSMKSLQGHRTPGSLHTTNAEQRQSAADP